MTREEDAAEVRRWYAATGHAHVCALRWVRTSGFAKHDGVCADLYEPPAIAGSDIEYLGGHSGKVDGRDMTQDEVRATRKLLCQMASEARDAVCGFSTLVCCL